MRSRIARRGGVLALATIAALLAGVAPASAATGDGSAYGVRVDVARPAVHVGPLSAADSHGPTSATLASVAVPGVLTAGAIDTAAHQDTSTGAVTASASTAQVTLPLLAVLGTFRAQLITATCQATQSGESGTATLTDAVFGPLGTLAVHPAPDTTLVVGTLARLTLNERVHNADGSLTVNAVHLRLLDGVGDVIVSSATCGPAGLPMPVASGLGLWIGLGMLGLVALPIGWSAVRRRRTTAVAV